MALENDALKGDEFLQHDALEGGTLTRARVAVSATFAMVGGQNDPPPSNSKTRKDRRPGDTAIDSS